MPQSPSWGLNITLTAVNSLLSLFTLPLIVNLALEAFLGHGKAIPLQFGKILQVFAIVLVPVAIGMFVRAKFAQSLQANAYLVPQTALTRDPAALDRLIASTGRDKWKPVAAPLGFTGWSDDYASILPLIKWNR